MENNRIEKHKEERKRMEWNGMEWSRIRIDSSILCVLQVNIIFETSVLNVF